MSTNDEDKTAATAATDEAKTDDHAGEEGADAPEANAEAEAEGTSEEAAAASEKPADDNNDETAGAAGGGSKRQRAEEDASGGGGDGEISGE
jgi:hypothetical protein